MSILSHFVRRVAPDVQCFAHFYNVVFDKKQLAGGLTEEHHVRAAANLFSGVSDCQAVRQDALENDGRERQGKARGERTGHVVSRACLPMRRVLRDVDNFSVEATNADAVVQRFRDVGG